jgi:hypothetical protein
MTGEDWLAGSFNVVRTSEKLFPGGQAKPKSKNKLFPKYNSNTKKIHIAKSNERLTEFITREIISALEIKLIVCYNQENLYLGSQYFKKEKTTH